MSEETLDNDVIQCMRLHAIAREAGPEINARLAQFTGFQISADINELARNRESWLEAHDLERMTLASLAVRSHPTACANPFAGAAALPLIITYRSTSHT